MCSCEANQQNVLYPNPSEPDTPCNYTLEQLIEWKALVICGRDNEIIKTNAEYNKYMGIILSGINLSSNICYLKKELDSISSAILNIINTGLC